MRHELVGRCGHQVSERPLRRPWSSGNLDAGSHLNGSAKLLDDLHVCWLPGGPGRGAEDATRIQRIVIAGKEEHLQPDCGERFACPCYRPPIHLVGLEKVPCDYYKLAALLGRDLTQSAHGVEPSSRPACLRVFTQEAAGHAQLPVAGMQKANAHEIVLFSTS
jgi:hypothetical protein